MFIKSSQIVLYRQKLCSPFSEIIILLEKLLLSEKQSLIFRQTGLLFHTSFGFVFEKQLFLVFLTISSKSSLGFCGVTSFSQIWFYLNGFLV